MTKETLKIGIIAAEHSGDRLGAKLLESLQQLYKLKVYGIGGPEVSSFNISSPAAVNYQDLQVMGLIEPIINLPRILSIRKKLLKLFINEGIDLFIGVDSPDFNMFFHKKLKADHVKTVQVVSPSVWGWRENRLTAIDSYIDITMCLFKFEHEFYNQKNISSFFLGHPFSDFKPSDFKEVMSHYQLSHSKDFISILPGSRKSEISHMMPIFIQAAQEISIHNPNVFFLIPAPNEVLASMIYSFTNLTTNSLFSEIPFTLSIIYITMCWFGALLGNSPHKSFTTIFCSPAIIFCAHYYYGIGVLKGLSQIYVGEGADAGLGIQLDDKKRK